MLYLQAVNGRIINLQNPLNQIPSGESSGTETQAAFSADERHSGDGSSVSDESLSMPLKLADSVSRNELWQVLK